MAVRIKLHKNRQGVDAPCFFRGVRRKLDKKKLKNFF